MKKRMIDRVLSVGLAMVMMVALPLTSFAEPNEGVNGGKFTDQNNLTWTANDGTVTTYGRGPKFSDVHPDITDPEYFLKKQEIEEAYAPEVVAELKVFVNSFDWINSDELMRASMVYNRIANGCHGNTYEYPGSSWYPVLMTGKGQCRDFSGEFKNLANFVGLECEVYTPSYLHQACLIKISGQWFALDPTDGIGIFVSNGNMYPVDYETEYNRYDNELEAKWKAEYVANPEDPNAKANMMYLKLAAGEITVEEYNAMWNNGEFD